MILAVHAQPGSKRDEIAGLHDGRLKVKVSQPPEGGRANERIVEVVAKALSLRQADVEVIAGATSRRKELALAGIALAEAQRRLELVLGSAR